MARYFVSLAYKGTQYNGWQVQPNAITVQQVLEEKLSLKLRQKINLTGAGRTDTGVHASFYIAHFDIPTVLNDYATLIHGINSFLPHDIKIFQIAKVKDDAHARFDALNRTYHYFFATSPNPFLKDFVWQLPYHPDLGKIEETLHLLNGIHDFEAFSKKDKSAKTSICNILETQVVKTRYGFYIKIKADRFLRNMVRAIVGTVLHIEKNNYAPEIIIDILSSRNRSQAASSAPPQGLFFTGVEYPANIYEEKPLQHIKNFLTV